MSQKRTLTQVLSDALPIPRYMRRHVAIERALQERRTAATALECIGAHVLCLQAELETLKAETPEGKQTLATMAGLLRDIETNLVYDELEMELASEEI